MSKAFFGGLPTAMDVRRLDEAFPEIRDGDEFSHEQIEQIIEVGRESNRYRTVTNAWRRKMLTDRNIEIGSVSGIGFRALSSAERVSGALKGFQSGTRKQLRSVRRAVVVKTDDQTLRRKQELMQRFGAAIQAQASEMMKEVEPPKTTRLPVSIVRKAG